MISQDYTGNNIVFIVGCPRSGTSFLRNLFAGNPKIRTTKETHLFDNYVGESLRHWKREIENASSDPMAVGISWYLGEDYFLSTLREYAFNLIKPHVSDLQKDEVFVEKTPNHAEYIPEIVQLFPDCKIVHIIRDPRDVVASLLAASRSWGQYFPKTAYKAAEMWVRYVCEVQESRNLISQKRFHELRYENLVSSPKETIMSMSGFMGIEWKEGILDNAIRKNDAATLIKKRGGEDSTKFLRKARPGSWREDLNWKQKLDVWRVARNTMNEVGYAWKYPW